MISELLHPKGGGWRVDHMAQLFDSDLTKRVLPIAFPFM